MPILWRSNKRIRKHQSGGAMSVNAKLTDQEISSVADPLTIKLRADVLKNGEVGCIDAIMSTTRSGKLYELLRKFFEGTIDYNGAAQALYQDAVETLE